VFERAGSVLPWLANAFLPQANEFHGASPLADLELEIAGDDNYWLNVDDLADKYGMSPALRDLLLRTGLSRPEE
jgi:hypothetical protein